MTEQTRYEISDIIELVRSVRANRLKLIVILGDSVRANDDDVCRYIIDNLTKSDLTYGGILNLAHKIGNQFVIDSKGIV